jgi:flagellar biosynthesis protein FlhB
MSGGSDKTEKPTARRLSQARGDGQVAKSTDLTGAFVLGGFCMIINLYGPYISGLILGMMQQLLSLPYHGPMRTSDVLALLSNVAQTVFLIVSPFVGTLAFAGLLGNFVQVRALFTLKPLEPKLSKLNPLSGMQRLFSIRSLVELGKGCLKIAIVGFIAYGQVKGQLDNILASTYSSPMEFAQQLMGMIYTLSFSCFLAYLALGLGDWRYQAFEFEKRLRMSKQDVKDEHKNIEGDGKIKAQVRQFGKAMIMKSQLAKVPTADVIITNPTHFAVAIRYDPDIAPAPHVVAKGVDHFALKIREVAKENNIMTVENRPLARSLYDSVEYGQMIPPDLFVAVAEVLAYVYRKQGGRKIKKK